VSPKFREELRAILTAHDAAIAALDTVEDAAHDVSTPLRAIIDAWDRVHAANKRAIEATRAANRAALELLASLDVQ